MRTKSWRHRTRAAMLGLILATGPQQARAADLRRHDGIHRIEKAHVTQLTMLDHHQPAPLLLGARGLVTACPASYAACPASLGGDCCPEGYACATASCYATTAAAQTCPGKPGYWVCGADVGGGCCPYGLICGRGNQCTPPAGQAYSQSCPASYYLCPSSLGFGCCENGFACATSACYATAPSTLTVTQTVTTTPAGGSAAFTTTVVETSTFTPGAPPTALPTDPSQGVAKFYPSYVPKATPVVSQTPDGGDGGGGLTTPQIAGIVAGSVGFLIVVLVAAYIIIRHLNNIVRVVESSQQSGSGGSRPSNNNEKSATTSAAAAPRTRPLLFAAGRPSGSDVDAMSVDPLMMSPSRPSVHRRGGSDDSAWGPPFDAGGRDSPRWSSGPRGSTPGSGTGRARYRSVPTTNASSELGDGVEGYFDLPTRGARRGSASVGTEYGRDGAGGGGGGGGWGGAGRSSRHDSAEMPASPVRHLRQWSNSTEGGGVVGEGSSEASPARVPVPMPVAAQELDATPCMPELPATPTAVVSERRRSSGGLVGSVGRPDLVSRTRRQSGGSESGAARTRGRSESETTMTTTTGTGTAALGAVSEAAEIHGHYGPSNRGVGQTAAGLGIREDGDGGAAS